MDALRDSGAGAAGQSIDRRVAVQWLALALATLSTSELMAQGSPTAAPQPATPADPITFLNAAELRRIIQAAPEEIPGRPGLYSLRLSGETRPTDPVVIGIRRTVPTRSELHAAFADVWYVLDGSATLVTGGAIVDGADTGPGEVRGRRITGGVSRPLGAGDFAVVPAGVPHWVSHVAAGGLLYLVVKVPTPS